MEEARSWLDEGNVLSKTSPLNVSGLGPVDNLAPNALKCLKSIQKEITNSFETGPQDTELIQVAVDDIKVIHALLRLVINYSLYRYAKPTSLPPFQPTERNWPLLITDEDNTKATKTATELASVLRCNDDVAKLLFICSDFTSQGIIAMLALDKSIFTAATDGIPTAKMYKALISLRSVPEPLPLISETIARFPILRKNAVDALIEMTLERETVSTSDLETTALILVSIPQKFAKKEYVFCLGMQLFRCVCDPNNKVADAACVFVSAISERQPRFIGHFRDLVLNPLLKSQTQASQSLLALKNMASCSRSKRTNLLSHLSERCFSSLWLLTASSNINAEKSYIHSFLDLVAALLNANPELVDLLVTDLIINKLPNNLVWIVKENTEPHLQTYLGSMTRQPNEILSLINERLDVLLLVLQLIEDEKATIVLIRLVREYVRQDSCLKSRVHRLLLVKTIERILSDETIRSKVFGSIHEVMDFTFSTIDSKVTSMLRPATSVLEASSTPKIEKLEIASDLADSDDEDDEEIESNAVAAESHNEINDEDNTMLALLLALLGAVLMEALGNSELELKLEDIATLKRIEILRSIKENESKFNAEVNEKSEFCLSILDGRFSEQSGAEPDLSDIQSVLTEAKNALMEPLPASQAYGIHLVTKLVEKREVSAEEAMSIFINKLGEADSFVYLNAIKGIEAAGEVYDNKTLIPLLQNYIKSDIKPLDKALRAREAFLRILRPASLDESCKQVIDILMNDLRSSAKDTVDIRFRMSSAAMLSVIIARLPLSFSAAQQRDATDCALGILRHEHADSEMFLRRAAVVLALEIVNAINQNEFNDVSNSDISALVSEISSISSTTDDDTLRDHCNGVLAATKLEY